MRGKYSQISIFKLDNNPGRRLQEEIKKMGHLYDSQLREVRTSIKSIYDRKVSSGGNLLVKLNAHSDLRYKN